MPVSNSVGHRCSLDLAWLWRRLAAAAPIPLLARELPYVADVAIKSKDKTKKIAMDKYSSLYVLVRSTDNKE